jgi:hypothetical protein
MKPASRRVRTTLVLFVVTLSCACAESWGISRARAQSDAPAEASEADVRRRIAAADRLLAQGRNDAAAAAYDALAEQLYGTARERQIDSFSCRMGVAHLRATPLAEAMRWADEELGTGLAVQTSDGARAACASEGGLALAEAAERAAREPASNSPPSERDSAAKTLSDARFLAAVWLRRARALRDTPALRSAFEALDPGAVAELARLSAGPPIEAADGDALARDLAHAQYAADPTATVDCMVDLEATTPGGGMIHCFTARLPSAGAMAGEYPHQIIHFVNGPRSVRAAGSATHMPGYDCENALVRETRSWTVLSRARDHLDGVMHVYREGAEQEGEFVDLTTAVDICDLAQRKCTRFPLGRRICAIDPASDRLVCTQDWEASVSRARGVLTFRRRRGTIAASLASSNLSQPLDLATLGAPTSTPNPPSTAQVAVAAQTPAHGACHAEVADPRPPLNVRADADPASAVVGTLANGTRVEPRGRRRGWTRVEGPIAGWIWVRNLRRVCE